MMWEQVMSTDMTAFGIDETLADDRRAWKVGLVDPILPPAR